MDFLQEFQTTNVEDFEYEDDVFYSELRRRVLQLTEDYEEDEEERVCGRKDSNMVVAEKQRGYYDWPPNKEGIAAPASIMNLWRAGNGTGVFIPQIVQQSKKKNRSSVCFFHVDVDYLIKHALPLVFSNELLLFVWMCRKEEERTRKNVQSSREELMI